MMVKFESRDPFPFLVDGSYSKKDAHMHSAQVDRWLGLRVDEIESRLAASGSKKPAPITSGEHQKLWFGLAPQDLLTPYLEIRSLLETLKFEFGGRALHLVDLGAAYGRMAFVIERHFPEFQFTGFEYVGERVADGARVLEQVRAKRSRLLHADLTEAKFQIPDADVYFIYDYGTPKAIEKTLFDLKRKAQSRELIVVARGRNSRYSIDRQHQWLHKLDPGAPEHAITIYTSKENSSFAGIEASV